jgi:hypothetical protein
MLVADKDIHAANHSVVTDETPTCCCCGRELKSPRRRVRTECEAYCRTCYGRLMFPDLRESDMEFLD